MSSHGFPLITGRAKLSPPSEVGVHFKISVFDVGWSLDSYPCSNPANER